MTFRAVQSLTVSVTLCMWLARVAVHPGWHPMLLIVSGVLFGLSELGYQAGKQHASRLQAKSRK